jgi:plasmid stabilization system protein ParE
MVRRRIIWSDRAKFDLINILDFYNKRNGTKTYSKSLNANIRKTIRLLEFQSEIGAKTDVRKIRNLIIGNYAVFYEIKPQTIEIITIWDSRQNPENLKIK